MNYGIYTPGPGLRPIRKAGSRAKPEDLEAIILRPGEVLILSDDPILPRRHLVDTRQNPPQVVLKTDEQLDQERQDRDAKHQQRADAMQQELEAVTDPAAKALLARLIGAA